MALNLPSDLDTQQGYIPIVAEGKHVKLSGVHLLFRSMTNLSTAIQVEKDNMEFGDGVWIPNTRLEVAGEPGFRRWTPDSATPANSHAKLFEFPNGNQILLGSAANIVTRVSDAPTANGINSGDKAFNPVTGLLYTWTTTWDAGVAIGSSLMLVRESKSGNHTIADTDFNTKQPLTGTNIVTVPVGLSQKFAFYELRRQAAGSTTLAPASGVTLTVVGGGSLVVTGDGEGFVLMPSGTPNKFYINRFGA